MAEDQGSGGTSAASGHLRHVDGLRALAALFVVVHHAYLTIWPIDYRVYPSGLDALLTNWAVFGHFGVSVFIVISGYVLALPHAAGSRKFEAGRFYIRRCRRILPVYYASIALCLVLIATVIGHKTGTHWDISIPVTRDGLIEHLLMVQHIFGSANINHVLWSIGVEWQIYLVFPLLFLLWRKAGSCTTLLVGTVVGYGIHYLLRHTPYAGATPEYLALFCMGMFAAKPPKAKGVPWGLLAAGSALIIVAICQRLPVGLVMIRYWYLDAVVGFGTACLLIRTTEAGAARRALEWSPLVRIGTFSYSLYLVHAPLLQVAWQLMPATHERSSAAFGLLLLASILPILGFSYLFFLAFERPFMSKRQRSAIESHAAP
ncbi:MAG TPA: acyltransferase [Fimbriimonadaceae bacterium]|nr:acyltransferase [Fimbriimonadaceae bacterium]